MISELQEQWAGTCDPQALAKQLEQLERECQLQLRRQATPQQYQNLKLRALALGAALNVLNTIEVK
ncbi:EscE/YscE/SsaE family type III secretion system needle protein co-chaperone [Pseudomonas entomophila]|uniref:EscE/YscE/SsaE family type III secretion system needle protein co-chaperone n=1 Tax=Pseudomonas entomophila TaxID=312306 RepID=UPI001EFFF436|nr:EscE/YscE/SsaE family type III secretion system needle protein co-chaperone [Pseudomonas entomophila]MCG8291435.1 EscE/YscE/SsaE family type III secretion system needle protein co-chaperone [Pseudomonas entomophila]